MEDGKKIDAAYIKSLTKPTEKFLCKLSDNTFKIRFGAFRIRDMDSGIVLVDVSEDEVAVEEE